MYMGLKLTHSQVKLSCEELDSGPGIIIKSTTGKIVLFIGMIPLFTISIASYSS